VKSAGRLLAGALIGAAVLVLAAAGSATSNGRPEPRAAGEDSRWPRTSSVPAHVRAIKSVVTELEGKIEQMELSADRYADWQACIRGIPVSEYGDPDRQAGYRYDERDGTGRGYMPALAVDRRSRPRREDYLFLSFSHKGDCSSNPTLPGGTADPASVRPPATAAGAGSMKDTLGDLERRVRTMKRSARRLRASSEHFDEWESCVSWVPVTEYGDPDRKFGYLFGSRNATAPGYRPALAVDRSDWDDPDYWFLALPGADRPARTCQDEPGQAVD